MVLKCEVLLSNGRPGYINEEGEIVYIDNFPFNTFAPGQYCVLFRRTGSSSGKRIRAIALPAAQEKFTN